MRLLRSALLVLALGLVASPVAAAPITIDFETFVDGDSPGVQFAGQGVIFSGGTVLTAGLGLNEFEFPSTSGMNVLGDLGGPIRIDFADGATSVSGFFTYSAGVTIRAYASNDSLLASATSAFSENFVSSGNAPGEFLTLAQSSIAYVILSGSLAGGSFVLDNLSADLIDPQQVPGPNPVPEPGTLTLLLLGAAAAGGRKLRKRRAPSI